MNPLVLKKKKTSTICLDLVDWTLAFTVPGWPFFTRCIDSFWFPECGRKQLIRPLSLYCSWLPTTAAEWGPRSHHCTPLCDVFKWLTATWRSQLADFLNRPRIVSEDGVNSPKNHVVHGCKLTDSYPLVLLNPERDKYQPTRCRSTSSSSGWSGADQMLFFLFHNFDDPAYGQGFVTILNIHKWFYFFFGFSSHGKSGEEIWCLHHNLVQMGKWWVRWLEWHCWLNSGLKPVADGSCLTDNSFLLLQPLQFLRF